jgi:SPP1 family predicted phage head-tail adaptor
VLTSLELTQARSDVLVTLTDTCTIQRATEATDDYGHTTKTWATAVSGVACRFDPFARQDSTGQVAMQEQGRSWYRLTLAWNTDLRDGDRVVYDSDTYEVLQLHDDHSARIVRRAAVAKVE